MCTNPAEPHCREDDGLLSSWLTPMASFLARVREAERALRKLAHVVLRAPPCAPSRHSTRAGHAAPATIARFPATARRSSRSAMSGGGRSRSAPRPRRPAALRQRATRGQRMVNRHRPRRNAGWFRRCPTDSGVLARGASPAIRRPSRRSLGPARRRPRRRRA
jgi:hypothetical protein